MTWISNPSHVKQWDVIIYACLKFSSGLVNVHNYVLLGAKNKTKKTIVLEQGAHVPYFAKKRKSIYVVYAVLKCSMV